MIPIPLFYVLNTLVSWVFHLLLLLGVFFVQFWVESLESRYVILLLQ